MECPNCGTHGKASFKKCHSCGEIFANQDIIELRQLEFLVDETATWEVAETVRSPYAERLKSLRSRLQHRMTDVEEVVAEVAVLPTPEPIPTEPQPVLGPRLEELEPTPVPSPEKEPFDQWLLSERNIKIALYSGGLLLVLAGLIFIGVNWTRIPGPGKFAITLLVTGLMYLGGYLLYQRPAYRIGGVALLGIASGFLTLNFAVLQIYVLGPGGLRDDVMWLIASPLCLLVYMLTAYWIQADLFTYINIAAIISTLTALLVVIKAALLSYLVAYALLGLVLLFLARGFRMTRFEEYTHLPLQIVSQVGIPVVILASIVGWSSETGCWSCNSGSPWLAIIALVVGVLFYVSTDILYKWLAVRWAATALLVLTFTFALIELKFSELAGGIALMILALVYVGIGYVLERREEDPAGGWPFYALAYILAFYVTLQSITDKGYLAMVMFGDVILLGISAAIHQNYWWVCGAAWLFMLPIYLVISMFVPALHNQGLLMGVLGLNYMAAGYALGRRELRLGGPFLTAAAFLSILTVALTWNNLIVVSLLLALIAVLYLLVALWRRWTWMLFPALLAVNLAVLTINFLLFKSATTWAPILIISYAILGFVLVLGALGLRRNEQGNWAWPLYIVGGLDLVGAYLAGLIYSSWLAFSLSVVLAVLLLAFAWLERSAFTKLKLPPLLTYLGIAVIFIGFGYLINITISRSGQVWPGFIAGLCALCVLLAGVIRHDLLNSIYSTPLRIAGLWLMVIPMGGALLILEPILGAITFGIAGVTYVADAALRRILNLAYLGIGAFIVVIWALLVQFKVTESQAYVIPLGIVLIGAGWNERQRGGGLKYRLPTLLGLLVLMGSAFVQSIPKDGFPYALLLMVESLIALAFGIRTHLRGYVQLGVLALIVNAVVQLGPGFLDLPRWIQIGVTGIILLGVGMGALFKREEILTTRKKLTDEWRTWES